MALSRQKREAQEADEFLKGLSSEESTPANEEVPKEEAIPAPAPDPTGSPEIDQLKTEVARLQAMLAEENSPTYRHRFEVLQGKYNAEIPRLIDRIKELEATKQQPPEQAPLKPEYETAFNDLVDEHGPSTAQNLITIAQSIAQEMVEKSQQQFDAKLQETLKPYDERVTQLTEGQQATAEQRFFAVLDSMVPDWKKINGWGPDKLPQDPKFAQFLDKTISGSDLTYNDLLLENYRKGNAPKVKEIFDLFKEGTVTPQVPAPKGVEQYIDPSKTGKGTAPPDNQPKTYTQAQVDAFFDSRIKGTFRGTREEATALENEYTRAIFEGRVR